MWSKRIIFLLMALSFALSAQTANRSDRKKQPAAPALTSAQKKELSDLLKPSLRPSYEPWLLGTIRTTLIEKQWPANLSEVAASKKKSKKNYGTVSSIFYMHLLNSLRGMVLNPDLEEVTKTRKSWYVTVGKAVAAYERYIYAAENAINNRNNAAYQQAIAAFPALSKQLTAAMKNPVKISEKEWEALYQKNTQRRREAYRKKQAEFWKKQQQQYQQRSR